LADPKHGEELLANGDLDKAQHRFELILEYDPENPRARLGLCCSATISSPR
jgi:hypothetical protein